MSIPASQMQLAMKQIGIALDYLREAKHEAKKAYSDSRIVDYHIRITILDLQQAIDTLADETPQVEK